jgi:phytoene synthase
MMRDIVEHSRQTIERGSKSFAAAARIFEPGTRSGAYLLYAWCRHCDDQTDGQQLGWGATELPTEAARSRLEVLRDRTRRALAGEPGDDPLFVGLHHVVNQHRIPHRYPLEHLEGFAMDVEGREYLELEDTIRYCYHVAGVVGVMMAYVMGVREEDALHRATDLGLAFQLTNIARDVMEDAGIGRVYLPTRWLEEEGVPVGEVQSSSRRAEVFNVTRRLLDEADRYYESAVVGLSSLPFRSAWAVATAKEVYQDIGRVIRARGAGAWDRRAATSKARKLLLAARGLVAALASRGSAGSTPRDGLWTRPHDSAVNHTS